MPELNRQIQPPAQRRLITTSAHSDTEILETQRLLPMSRMSSRFAKQFLKT